ncbi:hypothetical protein [Corynebacterium falsenii]|uniref:Uncharacterized protein n=1 Tax=Corynebacterium falsenii TaxID=108486 RepID=A0A418Q7D3_9CORY|nr:hypothetical protein [Corynebacterium falsenii]AHI04264.1 hypothetical protein CFAL_04100 [Corynebacterium falsenii DSM 44353]MDC7103734.1 hypothetical protein [Corynebacterium falsenii]RIX35214.1 hypothetical protein D3M95_04945 [Corynebacterium falsenii]UBI03587.1 hypothetical protein LA343_06000 [Corynebacterium falsenii]UBI06406.1 hypothetical protein LA329_09005 [Corynebacterium falsenii]
MEDSVGTHTSTGTGQVVAPAGAHRCVQPMIDASVTMVGDALRRSTVWARMIDGSLPFMGRAAYLEQHWEGLRVLRNSLESTGLCAQLRPALTDTVERLGGALDRSHTTATWREHHVTMPAMLEFRRRVNEMTEARDAVGLAAHAVVRLAAVKSCPMPGEPTHIAIPPVTCVRTDEDEEYFAEELSAATLLVLAHGSDVCRSYHNSMRSSSCAVTAAAIRQALM